MAGHLVTLHVLELWTQFRLCGDKEGKSFDALPSGHGDMFLAFLWQVGEGSFGKALLVRGEEKALGQVLSSKRNLAMFVSTQDGQKLICKMVDVSKASRREMEDGQ